MRTNHKKMRKYSGEDILHLSYWRRHICSHHSSSAAVERKGLRRKFETVQTFRGPVGRQVPSFQTSTVCRLIRSPGCHSIHHPTARHTALLSCILGLQSGFHTHPLMTKPDTGTDRSSSVGFQWQEIHREWFHVLWASSNSCVKSCTYRGIVSKWGNLVRSFNKTPTKYVLQQCC